MNTTAARFLALGAVSFAAAAWAGSPPGAEAPPLANSAPLADPSAALAGPLPAPQPELSPDVRVIDAAAPAPKDPTGASGLLASGPAAAEAPGAVPKMEPYTVTGALVPVFRDRDIETDKGMIAVSFRRHPGLHVGNAVDLNAKAARELFLSDDWRSTMRDYSEMARSMADGGDPAEGRMILSQVNDEDVEMRADGSNDPGIPAFDKLQVGPADNNSRLLQMPERPVDFSLVRVNW
jgi:hypothetical protein